jgi:hypothetical protein
MTEQEWSACTSPDAMLDALGDQMSARTLRYFLVACARRVLPASPDDDMLRALAVAEQFAEGTVSRSRLSQARSALKTHHPARVARWAPLYTPHIRSVPAWHATREQIVRAARDGAACCAWSSTRGMTSSGSLYMTFPAEELAAQASLLRDIFGNPFQPVSLSPGALTPTVRTLAQAAYDERILPRGELDPARLTILADALEEAGCDDTDLLEHLRGPGPHVRGCFVLDLLLDQE